GARARSPGRSGRSFGHSFVVIFGVEFFFGKCNGGLLCPAASVVDGRCGADDRECGSKRSEAFDDNFTGS
ncbi:hypothetical protein ACSTHX_00610, partial [Vibrio parahaemolyticus]